jgi:hypothetical protein
VKRFLDSSTSQPEAFTYLNDRPTSTQPGTTSPDITASARGVGRGSDVVKALALGACAAMIGRAYPWGVAASGRAGVENVLDVLRSGIDSAVLGFGLNPSTTCHRPSSSSHPTSLGITSVIVGFPQDREGFLMPLPVGQR